MSRVRLVLGLAGAALAGAVAGYQAGFSRGEGLGKIDGIVWSMGQLVRSQVRR